MTTVYLIRHGETDNNKDGRCNGCRSDQPLSARGEQQASALASYFDAHPVDALCVSHLTRARQTAAIAFRCDMDALSVEPDLYEVDLGAWDGMLRTEARERYPEVWYNSKHRPSLAVYPDGESTVDAAERIWQAFLRILRTHRGKRIAIVAHSAILTLLTLRIFNWDLDRKYEMAGLSNTGFHVLTVDESGHAEMACWNYTAHLPTALLRKPSYSDDVTRVAAECREGADLPLS